ncbi:hypothetical protein [Actomonas aquatica]|uniref:DUF2846 domain-containing protein n=1 Tax=Actomonas aquatica TaxID=2866162 RepID=A0ABZ1C2A2_9BACT|nr:hypothetical protein [Opitutus sp. WL0086]WRQ85799.1 hypothetical protein K1X11_013385 [Opitutus sp. WL0086]
MKTLTPLLVASALCFFAGCSSTSFRAQSTANLPAGASRLVVNQNGAPVSTRIINVESAVGAVSYLPHQVDLPAGSHNLMFALSGDSAGGSITLPIEAEAGRLYRVRTIQDGLGFRVRIWDETEGRNHRTLVTEVNTTSRSTLAGDPGLVEDRSEASRDSYRLPDINTNPLIYRGQ